jgi:hypothetical protein
MRPDTRLLMAANGGADGSFALMVNEAFQLSPLAGKRAGKQCVGNFRIFFNTLRHKWRNRGLPVRRFTPAFPRHIKFYSNSAQKRRFF